MSPNRRIFLNIVATYGRSLYALALGLFTARWALIALGQIDYGLFGLVGGLIAFVGFMNSILNASISRFYGISVGAAKKDGNGKRGLEECRQWFNTALAVHTVLPLLLVVVGYPLGIWAVENFLTIPPNRVIDCVWVWRFACVTCFIGMFNVPFGAMYIAKQELAELTMFSLLTTTGNAIFLYWMVTHPGAWLAKYAFGTCIIGALPQLMLAIRAMIRYEECRIVPKYLYDLTRYRQLCKFAFARFWSDFTGLIMSQGQAILVNKFMGPAYNASMTVGNSAAIHTSGLASAISGAFSPAIANLCGAGEMEKMKKFCFMTCRLGAILILVFAIPMLLEVQTLLHLWLKTPPDFAGVICVVILFRLVFDRMTDGYWMAIYSTGRKLMKYTWAILCAGITSVLVIWLCFILGMKMWSVVIGLVIAKLMTVGIRLVCGRFLVGFSVRYWIKRVFCPIASAAFLSGCGGLIVCGMFSPSLVRIVSTTVVCEIIFLPLIWVIILEKDEREYVSSKIRLILARIRS